MLKKLRQEEAAANEDDEPTDRHNVAFSHQEFLNHLVNFIVADDQVFTIQVFCWQDLIHCRRMVKWKSDIIFAVTAHWMARGNSGLSLQTSLLAFHRIYGSHDGENLAKIALKLLDTTGITVKVNIVHAIRASGRRRDEFRSCIIWGNERKTFEDKDGAVVILPELELLHDVRTRWDSLMTPMEWKVLDDFHVILAVNPHRVQQTMSAERCPTLGNAIPEFERYISTLKLVGRLDPRLQRWTKISLDWANKYYHKMGDTKAYVIAMLINPTIRLSWIQKHWDPQDVKVAMKTIEDLVSLLLFTNNPAY
ncbi:hypothetical protein BD779DRAFT_1463781 [Infundibulicybe gibba]|nr:hypothetical protein BD779DRAFT_1463781 [Infundibulicybe gibba]